MQQRSGDGKGRGRLVAPVISDGLAPKGRVEVFVTRGAPTVRHGRLLSQLPGCCPVYDGAEIDFSETDLKDKIDVMNIIVNQGKAQAISSLALGYQNPVLRMCIGDRGATPSDSTVARTPLATQTALFHEIYRADMDLAALDVMTPTVHQAQFIKTFNATLVPITSFSNQATPIVNEVGLITATTGGVNPFPRQPVAAPAVPFSDELLFATRTFKSVPFEAANDISVTIRYTIFQE